jgi:transcriptional regulator with XRE-family HTH domain
MEKTKREGGEVLTNRLWQARKRRGLGQKQVAYLLDHPDMERISRYERGARLPSLETALKLEIVYGVPLRLLFKELFDELEDEVWGRVNASAPLRKLYGERAARPGVSEYCAFAELLGMPNVPEADRSRVRRHVTALARLLAYL